MSRSSSKISHGNTSGLIGMFNNMSADEQQDSNHLTPRGVSSVSSLGIDTNNSSVIRKSSRSLSPSPLHIRLSNSASSSFLSHENNGKTNQIGLTKSTDVQAFGASSSSTLSPFQSRQRKVSAYVTSLTPPPPITVNEARSRKASAMPGLMPTKSALKSKSAYDNPTMNEKNVPTTSDNDMGSKLSTEDNIQHANITSTSLQPSHRSQQLHNEETIVNQTELIQSHNDNRGNSCRGGSGSNNQSLGSHLMLPDTDIPIRKVSALAALCPTNAIHTSSKQVTMSPSPSTLSVNLSGCTMKPNQEDSNESSASFSGRRGSGQNGFGRSKSFKCHRVKFGPSAVYDISGPSEQHQQEGDQQLPYYLRRPKTFSASPQGTSLHGDRTQGDERESNIERKGGMRNSPFEKFRQMEQNEDKSKSSDQQSRLSRQNSLPSVYQGENGKHQKADEQKGIPVGSAPPPVGFNSSQTTHIQTGRSTHTGTPLPPPSSFSPAPMIRSKTSHGIGQNQQGGTTFSAPGSPMSNAPKGPPTRMVARSPSSAKEMLLIWVQQRVNTYPEMNVTNFSSCWNDGLAFCALIHFYYPRAFDFSSLESKHRRHNFTLAFEMAEKLADICPLLEVDDMVRFQKPDWKCVFTYVQSFYRRFRNVPLPQNLEPKDSEGRTGSSSSSRPAGISQLVPSSADHPGPTFNKSINEATSSMAQLSSTNKHDTTVGDKDSNEKRIE